MITINKLLSRIRWDKRFGDAFFELEYEDRISGVIKIPLKNHRCFFNTFPYPSLIVDLLLVFYSTLF
ncbi:MAG: DUF504 domain-containing protein [Fibrobacter sp.]|nr:DUF504 domain-containing protein [Fibrobacter sp.]